MRASTKYATIGYIVSKFVMPLAKKQAKKAARNKAKGAAAGTGRAITHHPVKASIAAGAAVGAVGWLMSQRASSNGTSQPPPEL